MQPYTKSEPTPSRAPSPISLLSEWVQQGVDSYVATQRIILDLVMRQNATTMNAVRERLSFNRPASLSGMAELAGEGMTTFIDAQRAILNLASRQNEIIMSGVKERIRDHRATAVVNILQRSVDTLIDMQQHFLTLASKQTGSWVESAKSGNLDSTNTLTELTREGMEQFVRSQKKFLEVIAEETGHAAEAAGHSDKPKVEPTDISELARQSADSLIDTQKKLLDVAGRQVDLSLKTARKAMDMAPAPRVDFANLTKEYVDNFVAAQKALLDIMVKPRHMHASEPSRHTAAPSTAKTRRPRRTAAKHKKTAKA